MPNNVNDDDDSIDDLFSDEDSDNEQKIQTK